MQAKSTRSESTPESPVKADTFVSVNSAKPQETSAGPSWRPDNIEVECVEKACPLQVGILLFVGPPNEKGVSSVSNCTAFLSAPDVISSNGHCDRSDSRRGFFVSQKVNGQKSVREVSKLLFKKFEPGTGASNSHPDFAMFKLDKPITNMPALEFATGPQIDFDKLTAYSIFDGADENHYRVEARECIIRRHQAMFAFSMREAPDVIRTFNCKMAKGTSGSPMFAPGNPAVQSVHFASDDIPALTKKIREELKREPFIYEKNIFSLSTNVRCLNYPGAKPIACAVNDFTEANRRWGAAQQFEFDKLRQREFPGAERFGLKFSVFLMQIKSDFFEYELAYIPKCRLSPPALTNAPILIERLRLNVNEWGDFSPESISLVQAESRITANVADGYQLAVAWPPLSAPLNNPKADARIVFGTAFRIDIPVCPR